MPQIRDSQRSVSLEYGLLNVFVAGLYPGYLHRGHPTRPMTDGVGTSLGRRDTTNIAIWLRWEEPFCGQGARVPESGTDFVARCRVHGSAGFFCLRRVMLSCELELSNRTRGPVFRKYYTVCVGYRGSVKRS